MRCTYQLMFSPPLSLQQTPLCCGAPPPTSPQESSVPFKIFDNYVVQHFTSFLHTSDLRCLSMTSKATRKLTAQAFSIIDGNFKNLCSVIDHLSYLPPLRVLELYQDNENHRRTHHPHEICTATDQEKIGQYLVSGRGRFLHTLALELEQQATPLVDGFTIRSPKDTMPPVFTALCQGACPRLRKLVLKIHGSNFKHLSHLLDSGALKELTSLHISTPGRHEFAWDEEKIFGLLACVSSMARLEKLKVFRLSFVHKFEVIFPTLVDSLTKSKLSLEKVGGT